MDARGDQSETIQALATIGQWGKFKGNLERDFWKIRWSTSDVMDVPDPEYLPLTIRRNKGRSIDEIKHPIVLPSHWLHFLGKDGNVLDELSCGKDTTSILKYWDNELGWPVDQVHPWCHRPLSELSLGLPIAFHGDDVGVYEKEKYLVLSLHFVLPQATRNRSLIVTVLQYSSIIPGITLNQVYEALAQDLISAYDGVFSTKLVDGSRIPRRHWTYNLQGSKIVDGIE